MNFEISFKGMDKEINDDLYETFFPDYVHMLYETAKISILDHCFMDGVWSSYCGLTAYSTGRYFSSNIKGDLDLSMTTHNDEQVTCPTCLENFMITAFMRLP